MNYDKTRNKVLTNLRENKALIFSVKMILIFLVLSKFHLFYYGLAAPGGQFYSPFVEKYLNYPHWYRMFILHSSSFLLEIFGNETIVKHPRLKMIGGSSVGVGYSCLGFGVMSFIVAFAVAYPSLLKEKIKFTITTISVLIIANIVRIAILAYAYSRLPKVYGMKINHHTVFNAVVYTLIFCMVYFWVKKLSKKQLTNKTNTIST